MTEPRSFPTEGHAHYILDAPATIGPRTAAVVTLHGFSSNAETMLRLTRAAVGPDAVICALEAPNQFYTSTSSDAAIGFGWGTRAHWDECVRLHHAMVAQVFADIEQEFRFGRSRRVLAGFSQPVSLNYRFAVAHPEMVRGVLAVCGGVPKNFTGRTHASICHIARRADEYYPESLTETYPAILRTVSDDVEFHQFDGGHRFPSKAAPIVEQWLARLFV